MSRYTLTLVNPAIPNKNPPTVYTDQPGGNSLNFNLQNESGSEVTFTDSDKVQLKFPSSIMTQKAMNEVTVKKGTQWVKKSVTLLREGNNQNHVVLEVSPVKKKLTWNNETKITIELETLTPSSAHIGEVRVEYDPKDSRPITCSENLSCIQKPAANKKTLIGDEGLKMVVRVNDVDDGPLLCTNEAVKVTSQNHVENTIHINFTAPNRDALPLIDSWKDDNPPTFDIMFPFSPQFKSASSLTNNYKQDDDRFCCNVCLRIE